MRRVREHFDGNALVWRTKYDETGSLIEDNRWDLTCDPPALVIKTTYTIDDEGAQVASYEANWPDGAPSFKGQTRNGLEVGDWVFWKEDGSNNLRVRFAEGRLVDDRGVPSPPIVPPQSSKNSPAVQRIAEALGDECGLPRSHFPLSGFAASVRDQHSIPSRVNARALQEAGVPADVIISADASPWLTLRAALQILLRDAGLAPVVRRDVLVITTPVDASRWRDNTGLPQILRGPETPLRQSLQQITKMRFQEATLNEVFAFCREKHKFSIRLDESVFPEGKAILQTPRKGIARTKRMSVADES